MHTLSNWLLEHKDDFSTGNQILGSVLLVPLVSVYIYVSGGWAGYGETYIYVSEGWAG